ncbi:MAG: ATP-binding protein [Clostridia bacterium]
MKNRQEQADALSAQIQDKMRQTLQNLQNVVFTYSKREDGTLIYNLYEGKIAEELGLTTDTIYGKTLHQVFTAEQADYLTRYYQEAYKGTTVTYEFEYAGKMFHNVLSPIIENGEVIEVVGSAIDISDRKKMELELAEARDQALLSSRLKSEFLSTMSHEIRTPMNGIIGMLDLLLQSPLNAEQQRYATIMKTSANSLLAIINDILDFSKMEAGKMHLEITDFHLESLVEDTAELMAAKARGKQLSLHAHVDPSIPAVLRGDSGRIRQVLLNLIGNAIKFTNQGDITIRVTVETPHPQTPTIAFSIQDTGVGIPQEEFHRLFQPFTQIDGSASRQFGGTGLGLSICKRIVQLMDGQIGFESEVNKGSTFTFSLPLEAVPDQPTPTDRIVVPHRLEADEQTEQPFRKLPELTLRDSASSDNCSFQILLTEDNEVNAEIVTLHLQLLGVHPHLAKNGIEALACISRHHYDLILMDCQMPEMNGFETTRRIRQQEKGNGQHVPIIALTANAMLEDRQLCLEAGMDDYLSKPFAFQQLLTILEKWLPGITRPLIPFDNQKVVNLFRKDAHPAAKEKWHTFLHTFETQNHKALSELKHAIECQDQQGFSRILHATKSGCAFIGAITLVELLRRLEEIDCRVDPEGAVAHLAAAAAEFARVHAYLRRL